MSLVQQRLQPPGVLRQPEDLFRGEQPRPVLVRRNVGFQFVRHERGEQRDEQGVALVGAGLEQRLQPGKALSPQVVGHLPQGEPLQVARRQGVGGVAEDGQLAEQVADVDAALREGPAAPRRVQVAPRLLAERCRRRPEVGEAGAVEQGGQRPLCRLVQPRRDEVAGQQQLEGEPGAVGGAAQRPGQRLLVGGREERRHPVAGGAGLRARPGVARRADAAVEPPQREQRHRLSVNHRGTSSPFPVARRHDPRPARAIGG